MAYTYCGLPGLLFWLLGQEEDQLLTGHTQELVESRVLTVRGIVVPTTWDS